ncbi:MAG: glycoside hydrolase family 15 protein [Pelolinea sp.]|nr:glycoside hydrolase family 15 protein [Pelolinea sp.]
MTSLFQRSKEIILENQNSSGGYIASPNFSTYHYSWFRDSSFIAYSMNSIGEHHSADKFHQWAAENILKREETIQRAIQKAQNGFPLGEQDILHTRYGLTGNVSDEDWPNFQLDGFGTWLWALAEHQKLSGFRASTTTLRAAGLLGQYLGALWHLPCYDSWEEFPDKIHTYTLAAIYAGLNADIEGIKGKYEQQLAEISSFILNNAVTEDRLIKYIGSVDVDANLIGISVPYNLIAPTNPLMIATVKKIEEKLIHGGGLHRYSSDTYFGGGEWVLLTAWLGWYYLAAGEVQKAKQALAWVEAQADAANQLPEQVPNTLNDKSFYQYWVDRWGNIANPLLWSHAQYIILYTALNEVNGL